MFFTFRMPNDSKYKLPCITWVSTGDCPYGDKCQYIHINELKYNGTKVKTKTKKTNNFHKKKHSEELIFYPQSDLPNKNKYNVSLESPKTKRLDIFKQLSENDKENSFDNDLDDFIDKPDYSSDNIGPFLLNRLINFIQR